MSTIKAEIPRIKPTRESVLGLLADEGVLDGAMALVLGVVKEESVVWGLAALVLFPVPAPKFGDRTGVGVTVFWDEVFETDVPETEDEDVYWTEDELARGKMDDDDDNDEDEDDDAGTELEEDGTRVEAGEMDVPAVGEVAVVACC